ncbi:type 1 glutamine amidotransferase [Thioalkalivibrio sp.]|uniref:type 1 glutamine amidotransferase n=1 Tax=Thioalkalivibrio sp. TaxID=2093813 RepID=UPI003974877A
MHLAILQHVAHEGPAALLDWTDGRGHDTRIWPLYAEPVLPALEDFDGLIVLGGGMSVHDGAAHPWLEPERQLIRGALASGRPMLGICLGAQQLAHALGAKVFPGREREVGFWPIRRVAAALPLPPELLVCHWHGDTFELPEDAALLASSQACRNQVFVTADGLGLGLQCHLEATPQWVDACCTHDADYLIPGRWMQQANRLRAERAAYPAMHGALHDLLDAFIAGTRSDIHQR